VIWAMKKMGKAIKAGLIKVEGPTKYRLTEKGQKFLIGVHDFWFEEAKLEYDIKDKEEYSRRFMSQFNNPITACALLYDTQRIESEQEKKH